MASVQDDSVAGAWQSLPTTDRQAARQPLSRADVASCVVGLLMTPGFALAALWLLSKLPVVGGQFGWVFATTLGLLSLGLSAIVMVAEVALTAIVAMLLLTIIKRKVISVPLVALFIVWFWTDRLLSTQSLLPSAATNGGCDIEFGKTMNEERDKVKYWNDWFSESSRK
jgi:hypothetical protein